MHPFPIAGLQQQRGLYQSRRADARRLPVLRPLRISSAARRNSKGEPARLHPAGAAAGSEIRAAHRTPMSTRLIYDKARQEGARRDLYRPAHRRGDRAAGRSSCVLCAYPFNNTGSAADRRHRRALRSGDRRRAWSARTTASRSRRTCALFVDDEINPFIGTGVIAVRDRRFPGRQFRPRRAWASSAAASSRRRSAAGGRSRCARCRPARRAGARHGRRRRAQWYNHSFPINTHGIELRPPHQLSRSRSELQGRDRPPAGAHDLQSTRERLEDVGLPHRQGRRRSRARSNASVVGDAATAPRQFRQQRRPVLASTPAAPSWAPIRRPARSTAICSPGTPSNLFVMGGAAFPQNAGLQPDRHDRRADLLVAQGRSRTQYLKSPGPLVPAQLARESAISLVHSGCRAAAASISCNPATD